MGLQTFPQPRRLLVLFLAATLVPCIALVWVGWTLVTQDQALERQRVRDALDRTAASHLPPQVAISSFDVSTDGQRLAVSARSPIMYDLWSLDGVLSFVNGK